MKNLITTILIATSLTPQAQTCFQNDDGLSIYFCQGRFDEDIKFSGTAEFDFGYDEPEIYQIKEIERAVTIMPEEDGDDIEYSITFQVVGEDRKLTWLFSITNNEQVIYDVHFLIDGEMIYLRNNDCPEFVKTEYCK